MKKVLPAVLAALMISVFGGSYFGQTKKPLKKNVKPPATPQASVKPAQTVETEAMKTPAPKKNERPANGDASVQNKSQTKNAPNYFYEFSQPAFDVSKISIEHDESGKGKISFMKSISDEMISDPIEVSPAALERINRALAALDFVNSTENYQFEKDYSHLGSVTLRIIKNGRTRETKFNWTTNENARILMDEYRRIGNQYIWMFDMNLSRQNQPLESPRLMDLIDSYIKRSEISDAAQLVPFFKELGDDERIPLIARNHATRLIKQIEKEKK